MSLAGFDDLINRLSGDNSGDPGTYFFRKDLTEGGGNTPGSPSFGFWTSLWTYDGMPVYAATPGSTIDTCSNSTPGAMRYNATNEFNVVLTGMSCTSTTTGTLMLYDRLAHVGGLSGSSTSAQSVTGSDIYRYSDPNFRSYLSALGNMMFVELSKPIGSTSTTATVDYYGADSNVYSSPLFSLGGTNRSEGMKMFPVPLAQGINGGKEMPIKFSSFTLTASTGSTGAISLVLARPLLFIPCSATNVPFMVDLICNDPAVLTFGATACPALAYYASNTSVPLISGHIQTVRGSSHIV